MDFAFDDIKEMKLCDYVAIKDSNDDVTTYDVCIVINDKGYSVNLRMDNGPLIKKIVLNCHKLIIFYENGEILFMQEAVKEVLVDDMRLNKRYNFHIAGSLLQYDTLMANDYGLPVDKATNFNFFDSEEDKPLVKKKNI